MRRIAYAARAGTAKLLHAIDYEQAFRVIGDLTVASMEGDEAFAHQGVSSLARLVASEITTLSVCDLVSGRRAVVGTPAGAIGVRDRAAFDRHFSAHPLVQYHTRGGRRAQRISDCVPFKMFRRTALYDEYYRPVGLDHTLAIPLFVDEQTLVSFVLNRQRRDFSDRERALLDLMTPNLALLHRIGTRCASSNRIDGSLPRAVERWGLSTREREVAHWLAAGKADRDVADILAISPRTVHKHLQRIYEKLGVCSRTAALMRMLRARH